MNRQEAAKAGIELRRAWRRIFLDDEGNLTPDGRLVLMDIEAECGRTSSGIARDKEGRIDPYELALNAGKGAVFITIKRRLFEPLEKLIKAAED